MVPAARAALAAAVTASMGSSSWSRRISDREMTSTSVAEGAVIVPLAPGTTMIELPPPSSTTMWAMPDGPGTVRRFVTSTPAPASVRRSSGPKESSPTAPRKATSAPARAAAMAWLAPLPPGIVPNVCPVTVSPGAGAAST